MPATHPPRLRAVVFDLDDTLVHGFDPAAGEPVDVHYLSWRSLLEERGIRITRDHYLHHMKGRDGRACRLHLERAFGIEPVERIELAKERRYRERMLPALLRLRAGVEPFLEGLTARGAKLGILTNAPRANVKATFASVPLARWFALEDAVAADTLREAGLRPKPSGDGLELLRERFGATVDETLYVGDSRADVDTGVAAGVRVLAITANYSAATLADRGAWRTFASFQELDGMLGEAFAPDLG